MTDKRGQFLELLARGWSVRSACKKLGISRASGNRWKNGALVRQKDGTVKFVPPLEPLAVRTISPRFLSQAGRGTYLIGVVEPVTQLLGSLEAHRPRVLTRRLPGVDDTRRGLELLS